MKKTFGLLFGPGQPRAAVMIVAALVLSSTGVLGQRQSGLVKICKVAGPGVAVGALFTFNAGASYAVPAGPPPGGTCVLGPTLPVGSIVNIIEQPPSGFSVSSIVVAPASQVAVPPNLSVASVGITVGPGVTEVTYADYASTGYLEICKQGRIPGNFTFTVAPGGGAPIIVPNGACSPALQVLAGQIVVTEVGVAPNTAVIACATFPAGQQGPCNVPPQTSNVNVNPGGVSTQTIAIITNGPRRWPPPPRERP